MSARTKRKSRVRDLISWRREQLIFNFKGGRLQKDPDFLKAVYADILMDILVERIRNAEPSVSSVQIVREFYYEMDDILSESADDHFITHEFASMMENLAGDILRRWRAKGANEI